MTDILKRARQGLPLDSVTIIDAHGHMGPYFNFYIPWNDAAGMVETMDRLGIDQVCISAHASLGPDMRLGNDLVAHAVGDYPGRFIGYVGANPNYPEDLRGELERCFKRPGMRMIKLHPSLHGYSVNGPNYRPVWEWAVEKGCPVLIHVWEGDKNCDPESCAKVADEFPTVDFIFGHSGGPDGTSQSIEIAKKRDNVYLDLTGSTNTFGLVERFVREVGAEKVLYGSDIPFIDPCGGLAKVVYAKISDREKEMILGGNILRILGEG